MRGFFMRCRRSGFSLPDFNLSHFRRLHVWFKNGSGGGVEAVKSWGQWYGPKLEPPADPEPER